MVVVPVPKKTPAIVPADCRPISLLCAAAKLFEYVALRQIMEYIEHHQILDKFQSGYRGNEERGHVTLLIVIDLSHAFALVNTQLLVSKLVSLGFSDSAASWIASYLSGRTQVNDMSGAFHGCDYHSYADDTCFQLHGEVRLNGLQIKEFKIRAMWLGTRGLERRLNGMGPLPIIEINGTVIAPTASLRLLGVEFDGTLTWRPHCMEVSRKCYSGLARLRRLGEGMPRDTRRMLVRSLVFAHIDYCAAVLYELSGEMMARMGRCVNAALRFVDGLQKSDHITPSYRRYSVLTYLSRQLYIMLSLVANILRTGTPENLAERVRFRDEDPRAIGTRRVGTYELEVPRARLDVFGSSYMVGAAVEWNRLLASTRAAYATTSFRSKLLKVLKVRDIRLEN
ncbi:uncharacterized protein LOC106645205 [Copidosoma floridanum]|uniref:uncharacterized protein LOC106645205 n=1 Tax=Copidosoma floridanum TaxID=29053 RepID=UPI0006C9C641|nr:uncharacterized protein LOC106645205 [Copidosoma floridanum]